MREPRQDSNPRRLSIAPAAGGIGVLLASPIDRSGTRLTRRL